MSAPNSQQIEVLSYNVYLRPMALDGQKHRAAEIGRRLEGHDVLVLSEVFQRESSDLLLEALSRRYPYRTRILGEGYANEHGKMTGGVVILSRWPILEGDERIFEGVAAGPDALAAKGVLYARVAHPGGDVHVFGSHTQADPEPVYRQAHALFGRDADGIYDTVRDEQYALIERFVQERAIASSQPVLIAGDLNTDRLGAPSRFVSMLRALNASFPRQLRGEPSTFDPRQNSLCVAPSAQWLDYVLCSRAHLQPSESEIEVKTMVAERPWRRHALGLSHRHLSDHFAVLARMSFDRVTSYTRSAAPPPQEKEEAGWQAAALTEATA